jgi:hypothetical protein
MLNVIMLNAINLNVIMLNVTTLNAIMLIAIMMNSIVPNVIMLNVMAPLNYIKSFCRNQLIIAASSQDNTSFGRKSIGRTTFSRNSIAPIPSLNLPPISSTDGNITG